MPRILFFLFAILVACVSAAGQVQAPNVSKQFFELKTRADPLTVLIPAGTNIPVLTGANHWQGFARHPDPDQPYMYGVYSTTTCTNLVVFRIGSADARSGARLRSNRLSPGVDSSFVAPPATDAVVARFSLDSVHCGGIAAAGKYLAIPFYNDCSGADISQYVRFYDITNPLVPQLANTFNKHYIVRGDPDTPDGTPRNLGGTDFGVLGLCQLDNGDYFMAIGNGYNNYSMNFVRLTPGTPSYGNGWGYTFYGWTLPAGANWPRGSNGGGDFEFQSFQLVNPVEEPGVGTEETVYLVAMRNSYSIAVGNEEVWLAELTIIF